jgi:hypothetical protein
MARSHCPSREFVDCAVQPVSGLDAMTASQFLITDDARLANRISEKLLERALQMRRNQTFASEVNPDALFLVAIKNSVDSMLQDTSVRVLPDPHRERTQSLSAAVR